MAAVEAAALIAEGYQVVPLRPGTKKCKDENFLRLVFQPDDFEANDNIGIRSVNGIVIVDLDCQEAVRMADAFLPSTDAIYGRPSKPRSKRIYHCEGIGDKIIAFKNPKTTLLEIRVNHQDMAPPSIHPEGERLSWSVRGVALEVAPEALLHSCKLLATAALIAQVYANPGTRHDWTLALAGALRDLGLTEPEAQKVIEAAGTYVEDSKLDDRRTEIRSTYAREEATTSFGTLSKLTDNKQFVPALKGIWGMKRQDRNGFKTTKEGAVLAHDPANILRALDLLKVTSRFNDFSEKIFIYEDGEAEQLFVDRVMDRLRMDIYRRFKFLPSEDLLELVINEQAYGQSFHPVRDYLDGLEWDKTPRIDTWLTVYAQAKDTTLNRAVAAKVLMAAVRRVRQPGCKFDEMLVLQSKQGTLKSSGLQTLCPNSDWFSDDLPLNVDSKQVIERTGGKWIIEAGELNGFTQSDVERLKGFLARKVDGPVRMAYARLPKEVKRQFLIIGTLNDDKFLKDKTGNRRFWPIKVGTFDLAALRRDRDQLWAEAAHREANGESIRLPQHLWDVAEVEQTKASLDDPWSEAIEHYLATDCPNTRHVPPVNLWNILGVFPAQRDMKASARVSSIMQRLGYQYESVRMFEDENRVLWAREDIADDERWEKLRAKAKEAAEVKATAQGKDVKTEVAKAAKGPLTRVWKLTQAREFERTGASTSEEEM